MKISILILALGLLAAPLATQASGPNAEVSSIIKTKNSVKEVIDAYIKATGGEAKMKAVRNVEMKMQAEIQGMKLDMSSVIDQENQKLLNVTEMNGSVVSKTVVKDGAGKVMAMGQEQVLTEDQLTAMKSQMYGFRELYLDELGVTVNYDGTEEVEGEQAYKLSFEAGGEANTTEYYSVATGLKLQTESETVGTIAYKDYKEVGGLMMPMTMIIKNSMIPMPLEAKVTSIVFNQVLDDSVFN
ncbi:peptidase, M16 family protein [Algoriphagus sp. C2-6-M1]|uniref:peptidase, M16 family protein n=1 Tax=Algoriphagus persicinus TaxID=3108754 RepID=UPI002B3ACC78|nr:peptidase, M16 family protein [Algoriphagus sp. C2-6-M1]MEB2781683.1 peptidase, M16 family protein [Algoriphagus sp. C2-6-M1]